MITFLGLSITLYHLNQNMKKISYGTWVDDQVIFSFLSENFEYLFLERGLCNKKTKKNKRN